MTKSKIERLRQELIAKHGNRTIVEVVDRFSGRTIFKHTISTININCTADIKEVERIIMTGRPRIIRTNL